MERYINKKKIARGAFGNIIYAVDNVAQKEVVMKQLGITKDAKLYEKFWSEIKISKSLVHKNIVKYIESYKNDTHIILIYEYCNNGTLRDKIKELGKEKDIEKREEQIMLISLQLKDALEYLYAQKVIHRDLKPENILFNRIDNEIILKLADFGFSKLYDDIDIDSYGYAPLIKTVCGTPVYMAPELLLKNTYNIKADLWSVGVILYEMMYGYVPFHKALTIGDLRKHVIEGVLIFDSKIKYSDELINLVRSLLVNDSEKRIDFPAFFNHPWFHSGMFYSCNSVGASIRIVRNIVDVMEISDKVDFANEITYTKKISDIDDTRVFHTIDLRKEYPKNILSTIGVSIMTGFNNFIVSKQKKDIIAKTYTSKYIGDWVLIEEAK